MDNLENGIALTSADGNIVAVNSRMLRILGVNADQQQLAGTDAWSRLADGSNPPASLRDFKQLVAANVRGGTPSSTEVTMRDGTIFDLHYAPTSLESYDRAHLWSLHEVTQRVRNLTDVVERLQRDELTGLASRSYLLEQIAHACQGSQPYALLYIDLDDFKQVNDEYGHQAGDATLKEIGHRIQSVVRTGDVCSRLSGDEFCVLAYGVRNEAQAETVARKLISALVTPVAEYGIGQRQHRHRVLSHVGARSRRSSRFR